MATSTTNRRRYLLHTSPFICLHAVLLLAVSWQCLALLPKEWTLPDAFYLTVFHLRELLFLALLYCLLGTMKRKWALPTSSALLIGLMTLTGLYFVITIKTRVVYGASYLLDEFVPFVLYYGPSYVTPFSVGFALAALVGLASLPYLLLALGKRAKVVRGAIMGSSLLFLSLGTLGWFSPLPTGVPEYISQGPLQLLVSATITESDYRERFSAKLAEVDGLLDSSLGRGVVEPPAFPPGSVPFEKVILYQMEGVPELIFRPDSDYASLLPRMSEWSHHAIQFTNHYTLSTLTFHSYQAINIGGYIRSGSRLENVQIGSLSLVRPLAVEGFETAFFSAADLYYRGTVKFLRGLGFDTVTHFGDYSSSYPTNGKLIDDRALIDGFREWAGDKKRFFAVINPMGTHHPYWNPEEDLTGDFRGSGELRRYLNAVHYQDKILGELLDYVDRDHPGALVVVLSDHGIREYFAELEESILPFEGFAASFETRFHVPLFFYNRRLFPEATRYDGATSHVDILPTVLHLMGFPVADRPLGGSNICAEPSQIHFLNTQHNLDVLALLDGRHKFILERETGDARLFLLDGAGDWKPVDPAHSRDREEHYRGLVTAWYRYLTE